MPNHWHQVLWPAEDGELSAFVGWLSNAHVRRWHAHYHSGGSGHVYQGRFKSFPVQDDRHLLTALRYVEANPLRARLVERAEAWRWSSLCCRERGVGLCPILDEWPVDRPADWVRIVNEPLPEEELARVQASVLKGTPLGKEDWVQAAAGRLGLEHTLRRRGRPKKGGL
jgi:putative transposase